MPKTARKKQRDRRRTLPQVIRDAIERELTNMEDGSSGKIDDWKGDALASHVTPGVLRSVSAWLRSL